MYEKKIFGSTASDSQDNEKASDAPTKLSPEVAEAWTAYQEKKNEDHSKLSPSERLKAINELRKARIEYLQMRRENNK